MKWGQVFLEKLFSAPDIRKWHHDDPVEPSWSQKSFIKDIGSVGSSKDDDFVFCAETFSKKIKFYHFN